MLTDPNFRRSVVLLLQHDGDARFRLVVNRPARRASCRSRSFSAGRVTRRACSCCTATRSGRTTNRKTNRTVAPGIFLGDHTCLTRVQDLLGEDVVRCRLFKSYAGWGRGGEGELAQGPG
jgi:putative AlgH/UPF0301 family transcriptional regulator